MRYPFALMAAVVCAGGVAHAKPAPDAQGFTTAPDSRYGGPDWSVMQKHVDEALKGGPAAIVALADALVEPGKGSDFQPRYTLCAIGAAVGAPGREAQRRIYVDGLCAALAKERPKEIQKVLLLQLQFAGDAPAAQAVGKFLGDEDLNAVAAMALAQIGGEAAAETLRAALPAAKAPRLRANILRALGETRDVKAAPALSAALSDGDRDVRISAAYALAQIGDPSSAGALLKAADVEAPVERGEIHAAALRLGRRLVESGKGADAARLYLAIWTGRAEVHLRAAAIEGLARFKEASAEEALGAAVKSEDQRVREAAIAGLAAAAPADALKRWYESIAAPEGKALFLRSLAGRTEAPATDLIEAGLKDATPAIRNAAAAASGKPAGGSTDPKGKGPGETKKP
jgi:HEAT repeat protein